MKTIALFLSLTLTVPVLAHEGHDHDGPSAVQAQKGGVIKSLENVHVEVLPEGRAFKIFFFTSVDGVVKAADPALYKVSARAQLPRGKKKAEAISLTTVEGHLEGTYDAKGAHRYQLLLSVKDPTEEHADELNFTMEPKR